MNNLRNKTTTTGSATVTNNNVEYVLTTTANGSDDARLESVQKGTYIAGLTCEVGLGVRIPTIPVGNQEMKWGYYDNDNGYYFKLTASGLSVNILRNGVEQSFPQSNWNRDTVDGQGGSGYTIDVSSGIIYTINFSWYGFGSIVFGVTATNEKGDVSNIPVHKYVPQGETSTANPNLPIRVSLKNNGTTNGKTMYVAGRQFSVVGRREEQYRTNQAYTTRGCSITEMTPLMSVRKQVNDIGCDSKCHRLTVKTDQDILLELRENCTLTNASFSTLPDRETIMEVDTSATSSTLGNIVFSDIILCNTGGVTVSDVDHIHFENVTLLARSISGTQGNVLCSLQWREEW